MRGQRGEELEEGAEPVGSDTGEWSTFLQEAVSKQRTGEKANFKGDFLFQSISCIFSVFPAFHFNNLCLIKYAPVEVLSQINSYRDTYF